MLCQKDIANAFFEVKQSILEAKRVNNGLQK
jgi:hypothetical protein